jgi:hypothetical protein
MEFRDDYVIVSSEMDNCFTEELDQILTSGNEIPINFNIELFREKAKEADSTYSFYHILQFSPIDDNFNIFLSEKNEYFYSLDMQRAKFLFTNIIEQNIISSKDISQDYNYYIKITAWLDKIKVKGMDEELNLIYYWNSIKPSSITTLFSKSDFQS